MWAPSIGDNPENRAAWIDYYRRHADAILASDALAQMLAGAEQRVAAAVEALLETEWLCATASDDSMHPAVPAEHLRAALTTGRTVV